MIDQNLICKYEDILFWINLFKDGSLIGMVVYIPT